MRSLEPSRAASTPQPRVLPPERGRAALSRVIVWLSRITLTLKNTIPTSRQPISDHPDAAAQHAVEQPAARANGIEAGQRQRRRSAGPPERRVGTASGPTGVAATDWRGAAARRACPCGPLLRPPAASAAGLQLARHPQLAGRGARVRGDLARGGRHGARVSSSASGVRPQTQTGKSGGQMHPCARSARKRFTRRSSSEWKEIAASRPPGAQQIPSGGQRRARASRARRSRRSGPPGTRAWRDGRRRTGRPPAPRPDGSTSSEVVSSGARVAAAHDLARDLPREALLAVAAEDAGQARARPTCSPPRGRRAPASGSMRMSSGAS